MALFVSSCAGFSQAAPGNETPPVPEVSTPSPPPPVNGIVVLFSGKQEEIAQNWVRGGSNDPGDWKFEDGYMTATGHDIASRQKFTDFQLHLEWREPYMPNAHGQGRGNSGVYLQDRYEIQVLDSYGIADPGQGDCGAVYSQAAPLVNACKPPLQWQTYDMIYRAPRFDPVDPTKKLELARVTVFQNGVIVQNNQEIRGGTAGNVDREANQPGPLRLQFHGNPISYRNIWVLPLPASNQLASVGRIPSLENPAAPAPALKGMTPLFTGKQADISENWVPGGTAGPGSGKSESSGDLYSKQNFDNFQLHMEFQSPGRVRRQPTLWQGYDIVFRAPHFDAADPKKLLEPAYVTVLRNGIAVQDNHELQGAPAASGAAAQPGRLLLRSPGKSVVYRNSWILPLPAHGALHY